VYTNFIFFKTKGEKNMKEHTCTHSNLGCGNPKKRELGAGKALVLGSGADKSLRANKKFDTNKNLGAGKGLGAHLKKFILGLAFLLILPLALGLFGCSTKTYTNNESGGVIPGGGDGGWETEHTVTFYDRGNLVSTQKHRMGTGAITKPADPTRDGWRFVGWGDTFGGWNIMEYNGTEAVFRTEYTYGDDKDNDLMNKANIMMGGTQNLFQGGMSRDTRFDAIWVVHPQLTVDTMGASEFVFPTLPTGHYFGWGDFGVWEGPMVDPMGGYSHRYLSDAVNSYGRAGYQFVGFYAAPEVNPNYYTVPQFNNNGSIVITEPTTIYMGWHPVYTLTFNTMGGSYVPTEYVEIYDYDNAGTYETALKENVGFIIPNYKTTTRAGYRFLGWYDAQTGGTDVGTSLTLTTDFTTIYAHWVKQYTVTFNVAGGSSVAPVTLDENTAVTKPQNPTRAGYKFLGWFTAENGGAEYNFTAPVTADTTLYARWEQNLVVTFDMDGGAPAAENQSVESGAYALRPTNPTKDGYKFVDWYNAQTGGAVFNFATTPITANTTIYARFKAISVADGGVWYITSSDLVMSGMLINQSKNLGIIKLHTDGTFQTIETVLFGARNTADITGWEITGENEITFGCKSGDFVATVNGSTMRFTWNDLSGNPQTFQYTMTKLGDIGEQHTITYSGAIVNPQTVTAGDRFTKPALKIGDAVNGKYFVGWYTAEIGGAEYTFTEYATGNITVYARLADTNPMAPFVGTWKLVRIEMVVTGVSAQDQGMQGTFTMTLNSNGTATVTASGFSDPILGQCANANAWAMATMNSIKLTAPSGSPAEWTFTVSSINDTTLVLTGAGIINGSNVPGAMGRITFTKQ
jgi:uncharacterized repeat protein (TIGR02543 family)